jgi:hypothetical protein
MPAFVNRRLGESGSRLEEGTIVCLFSLKKSRKLCRISSVFIVATSNKLARAGCRLPDAGGEPLAARERLPMMKQAPGPWLALAYFWASQATHFPSAVDLHLSSQPRLYPRLHRFFASSSRAAFTVSSSSAYSLLSTLSASFAASRPWANC